MCRSRVDVSVSVWPTASADAPWGTYTPCWGISTKSARGAHQDTVGVVVVIVASREGKSGNHVMVGCVNS
jgi:hypothetical protein